MDWDDFEVLSNLMPLPQARAGDSFENGIIKDYYIHYHDDCEDRVASIISQLHLRDFSNALVNSTISDAILSLSRFVSLMGDFLDVYQEVIKLDDDLSDSIEISFPEKGITRFNLMLSEPNSFEEAFLFYYKDGRPTQVNGSLPTMVGLLKQILK